MKNLGPYNIFDGSKELSGYHIKNGDGEVWSLSIGGPSQNVNTLETG